MKFSIVVDSSSPINIKAQIAAQIKLKITKGILSSGDTMPTVIELAKHLGINHNTVAAVYNELIESGYLIAQRGKGTFIAQNETVEQSISHQNIYALLAKAYNLATQFGFNASDFSLASYAQAVLSSQQQANTINLVFIATKQYSEEIYEAIKAEIEVPILFLSWSNVKAKQSEALEKIETAELLITTTQHLWFATSIANPEQEVFAVDFKPDIELLIRLSSILRNARLLLVAEENAESEAMKEMLERAGIHHLNLQTADLNYLQSNPQILEQVDKVCVSRLVEDYVRQQLPSGERVIVFNFNLEPTNISLLKARLAAIQSEQKTADS